MFDTTMNFIVEMKPVGWERPGGTWRRYTPRQTRSAEELIGLEYNIQCKSIKLHGAIRMYIEARMPIPKSDSAKTASLKRLGHIRPTIKPDADNIGKLVKDALNGIAYDDDKQVVDDHVVKLYADIPSLYIRISGDAKEGGER